MERPSDVRRVLAARAGSQTVANCASCHGVHNIFPASDPRSTVNPAHLARTCGPCHPGAGERFSIGPVHVFPESRVENPVVGFIRRTYWVLVPVTIGFIFLHLLEWEAATMPRLFPLMKGEFSVYPLTSTETQLDFLGVYKPPFGAVGKTVNAAVGHRIAEVSVHRFISEAAGYLRQALA